MNDIISRAARAAIEDWKNDFKGYVNALNIPRDDYKGIMQYIDEVPSAQPERKRGRWIVHYECPKCGEITKDFTEYCPFCNADMRGEEDE